MSARNRRSANRPDSNHSPFEWWDTLLAGLFLTRFLTPTEGSDRGLTLWIVLLWWFFAAVYFWSLSRQAAPFRWRWTSIDWGVLAFVGGQLVAGVWALLNDGTPRATLNLMWEWSSLGVTYVLLKHRLHNTISFHGTIVTAYLAAVLTLSCLGIWQHFIWYPHQSAQLDRLLTYHQLIESGERLTESQREQYEDLAASMGTEVLTLDDTGRALFLSRVRESVEPIGRFALANTFAALLAIALIMIAARFFDPPGDNQGRPSPGLAVAGVLVGFCLVLTKSRTAWVGTGCGVLMILLLNWWGRSRFTMRTLITGTLAGVLIVALSLIAWSLGGLDRQVLSEAPKSLTYRLEYWQATARLIADHPLIGIGPGNFRQHYLRYKLPGSSEEILDPHNMFLDAWANGGLLALAGLVGLTGVLVHRLWQAGHNNSIRPENSSQVRIPATMIFATGLLAIGLVFASQLLFSGTFDEILAGLAVVWTVAALLFHWACPAFTVTVRTALAACAALLVHLLGAGGIGMPAITQLLFLLLLLSDRPATTPESNVHSFGDRSLWSATAVSLAAALGCLWSAFLPTVSLSTLMPTAEHAFIVEGRLRSAQSNFERATELDSLSPEPWQRLSMVLFARWERSGARDDRLFNAAINAQQQAITRDVNNTNRYRTLAELWMKRFAITNNPEDAAHAVDALNQAIERYPHHAQLRADFAIALSAAGQPAVEAATLALQLDELNIAHGHAEKQLARDLRENLQRMVHGEPTTPPQP